MRAQWLLALILAGSSSGCFAPDYGNGHLLCQGALLCPDGFHCASDQTCWRNGQNPDMEPMKGPTGGGTPNAGDMAIGGDPASLDLSMGSSPDLSSGPPPPPPPTCVGTSNPPQCQMSCPGGATTLTGTVFAPNGTLPLYNAIVYVPSETPDPIAGTVTCGACTGQLSGKPIVTTLSGPDGTFTLANVPVGAQVPLVVQIGKWRKQSVVNVPACVTTAVAAAATTLPKNSTQGDMPKIAIATATADPFECELLKFGIDPAEIQPDSANKQVAFFVSNHVPGTTMPGATAATALYPSLTKLLGYDLVVLPCEGGEYDQSTNGSGNTALSPDPRGLLVQYVNAGGRVFATHYSYDWLTYPNSPFNAISQPLVGGLWDKNQTDYPPDDTTTTVAPLTTSFPKALAFAQWLIAAGATSTKNTLGIQDIRHDIDAVDPTLATAWITDTMPGGKAGIADLSFNTPLQPAGGPYCGRVVFTDFHASATAVNGTTFPAACVAAPLTDQEKALAFMFFDLSSCVLSDSVAPTPPSG